MTDRTALVIVNGQVQQLQAGDTLAGQQQVYQTATPPTITYPAINFLPVVGFTGLYQMQVNA